MKFGRIDEVEREENNEIYTIASFTIYRPPSITE